MNDIHQRLLRALVAAQVAVVEHADEDVNGEARAKPALVKILAEVNRLVKKLDP